MDIKAKKAFFAGGHPQIIISGEPQKDAYQAICEYLENLEGKAIYDVDGGT